MNEFYMSPPKTSVLFNYLEQRQNVAQRQDFRYVLLLLARKVDELWEATLPGYKFYISLLHASIAKSFEAVRHLEIDSNLAVWQEVENALQAFGSEMSWLAWWGHGVDPRLSKICNALIPQYRGLNGSSCASKNESMLSILRGLGAQLNMLQIEDAGFYNFLGDRATIKVSEAIQLLKSA